MQLPFKVPADRPQVDPASALGRRIADPQLPRMPTAAVRLLLDRHKRTEVRRVDGKGTYLTCSVCGLASWPCDTTVLGILLLDLLEAAAT